MSRFQSVSFTMISILLVVIGITIVFYYARVERLDDLKFLPVYLLVELLIYIILQVIRRNVLKQRNWWDWVYYIGLIGIVTPMFIDDLFDPGTYIFLVLCCTGSLVVSPGIDLIKKLLRL